MKRKDLHECGNRRNPIIGSEYAGTHDADIPFRELGDTRSVAWHSGSGGVYCGLGLGCPALGSGCCAMNESSTAETIVRSSNATDVDEPARDARQPGAAKKGGRRSRAGGHLLMLRSLTTRHIGLFNACVKCLVIYRLLSTMVGLDLCVTSVLAKRVSVEGCE